MSQVLRRSVFANVELFTNELKQVLPVRCVYTSQKRNGRLHASRKPTKPITTYPTKEWEHKWYKWDYEPLPTQTSLDVENPHFSVRPPEFKLTKNRGHLTRKKWRQRVAEISSARQDPELEKLARNRQLMVSVNDVENDWREEFGLADITNLASFYGIDKDLFNSNNFDMQTWVDISFDKLKIHRGNIVEPVDLSALPTEVSFTCGEDYLMTLVLTNLDSHPLDSSKEVLHWMVCNIPNGKFSEGETLMEYLPPIPWKGSGYHRHVFALYKHRKPVVVKGGEIGEENTLGGRTFSSWNFTSSFDITPVGLAWCQVQWDESVSSTCSLLEDLREEPVFDLEGYVEPKEELKILKRQASELRYRDM